MLILLPHPTPDLTKMKTGASLNLQFALKLFNIEDDLMTYTWELVMQFKNLSRVQESLTTGELVQEDGWISVELSGIILPDLTELENIFIKVRGAPNVDFLMDNVNLLIDI